MVVPYSIPLQHLRKQADVQELLQGSTVLVHDVTLLEPARLAD
jgi:hypothetical protein